MKLALVFPSATFSTFDVANGIRVGLSSEGHEVIDYRLANRIILMQAAFKRLYPDKEGEPDMGMICMHASEGLPQVAVLNDCKWILVIAGMGFHPNTLYVCRKIGLKIALWLTEAPYDTDEDHELYLAQFADLVFVNERTSVATVQATVDKAGNGGRVMYLPHAYNPELHKPGKADPETACDVLFVGTGFTERRTLFESIDWTGINLTLGGQWPGLMPPNHLAKHLRFGALMNEGTVQLYHGAKIILNPHRRAIGAESANPRTYEAAACGVFQIADYRAEIAEIFQEAVPTFQPDVPWQLSALIRRYLADDTERQRLAALARERVQGQTFQARARTIVEAIEEWESEHRVRLWVEAAGVSST